MSRTRTYSFSYPGGGLRYRSFNGTVYNNDVRAPFSPYIRSVCTDDVGFGVDHGLNIQHVDISAIQPLTGEQNNPGGWHYKYLDWLPDYATTVPVPLVSLLLPSAGVVATATLAKSNPSRPVVSLPNFIYELKDLPGMLREIGKLKLLRKYSPREYAKLLKLGSGSSREAANHFLSYQMGWVPLISDLRSIITFQSAVKNRMKDLDVLFNQNGGLHRTVGKPNPVKNRPGMWQDTQTSSSLITIESALSQSVQVRADKVTTSCMWGSVRWTNPWPSHNRLTHQELESKARALIFGAYITPKEIWDAVPWTWLEDWFANFGDYLDSTNNVLSLSPSTPCIMSHIRTEESWTRTPFTPWITGGGGTRVVETKTRVLQGATLSASMPIISAGHLAILGALALQRSR